MARDHAAIREVDGSGRPGRPARRFRHGGQPEDPKARSTNCTSPRPCPSSHATGKTTLLQLAPLFESRNPADLTQIQRWIDYDPHKTRWETLRAALVR
jgi:hypothetical protein